MNAGIPLYYTPDSLELFRQPTGGWLEGSLQAHAHSQGMDLLSGMDPFSLSGPLPVETGLGRAMRWTCQAVAPDSALGLSFTFDRYPRWPTAFILQVELENHGSTNLSLDRLEPACLSLPGFPQPAWSFQGAAVSWGQDFAFPLMPGFHRDNYLGHVDRGEGGGIPLLYAWGRRGYHSGGLALAHIEPLPLDACLPVGCSDHEISLGYAWPWTVRLPAGGRWISPRLLLSAHPGDFYAPLALYREILAEQGQAVAQFNPEDYEPAWCSWGYEFDVTPAEVTGVLPVLGELGIHWLTLDDRWFDTYGDWNPRPDTFPGGDEALKRLTAGIHAAGGLAQLWWYPLAVEDGLGGYDSHPYTLASLLQAHPDWLILNPDGEPARNNRGLVMLCPAVPAVQDYIHQMTLRFIQDWDFDGHKLDNIYSAPACYNPAHGHVLPQESTAALADVYRIIYATTRQLKPYSVTQLCPCGTPPSFHLLPYTDQPVTADPTSSAQVRQRVKFYKALFSPCAPVFADHVELSDGGDDFASQVGVGAIPAVKFVWPLPLDPQVRSSLQEYWPLGSDKKAMLERWLGLYRQHDLARAEYLNLYDLVYDFPEGHALRRGERLYYAFYIPRRDTTFHGLLSLRGLADCPYHLVDYANDRPLGAIHGPLAIVKVEFTGALLLYAEPDQDPSGSIEAKAADI